MKKSVAGIIVVIVIVVAGGGILLANKNSDTPKKASTDSDMSTMDMSNTKTSTDTNSSETATNTVIIQNFAFSPANITIKKGTTVTWTNKDSVAHTVTENDSQAGPNSGNVAPGKSYSFTYSSVGTFKFYCEIHPEMTGTVTVTE